ncbi:type IV secretion system protein, partial [Thioclava sp. BHET1]
ALLEPSSAAYNKIADYMREPGHQPIELAKTETVSPQITTVNYLGGTTWQVQWFETAYDRHNGKQISRKSYTATMVLAFHSVTDSGTLQLNPLGLFITEIDMQENNG